MPESFTKLERHVLRAFRQALADGRNDVADHLLYALEALDPEVQRPALRYACQSFLKPRDDDPPPTLN